MAPASTTETKADGGKKKKSSWP